VNLPAVLQLVSGDRRGTLLNLSATGAKIRLDDPPAAGLSGMLKWAGAEAFCKVIWTTGDTCGVAFERPLPRHVTAAVTARDERRGPVAGMSNIQPGRKRRS
jgi:hypothetical protein